MENFTPLASLSGGILLGIASALLLFFVGRIAGISGIFGGLLNAKQDDTLWRAMFIGGLLAGGVAILFVKPDLLRFEVDRSTAAIIVAGLLVGIGARLGNGCTSGHGVCGIGRLSPRSLIAVATFMTAGAVTAIVVNHLLGGRI
jgi:uncharacterized membrane protein YedE/YeeE